MSLSAQMDRYASALVGPAEDAGPRLDECLTLTDPDLAGDCALVVIRHATTNSDGDPELLCPMVPKGIWREECWFEAAELVRRKSKQRAVSYCDRATRFRDDCRQHLWQGQLKRLVNRYGPDGFAEALPEATELHDEWAVLLDEGEDHSYRYWLRFYQAGLGGMHPLDLEVCEGLPDVHRDRCVEAGAQRWAQHLEQALEDPAQTSIICRPGDDLVQRWARLGERTHALPHPRLEQEALAFQQANCMQLGG